MVGSGAWSPEKVARFKSAFFDFLKCVFINSKDKGGGYCLADGIYESQHRFLDGVFDGLANDIHDVKVLKSRQLGLSTICEALFVFYIGMIPGIQASVIFDTSANLRKARARVKAIIEGLPAWLNFPTIVEDSRELMTLSNGARVSWLAAGVRETESSGGLGRSEGTNLLWASEISSWKNQEGIVSLIETLSETFPDRLFLWESPLALDTPVLTPHGWKTIGSIAIGDMVYAEDGHATEVVGLSPVFEGRRCFKIVFNTGEEIISDAAHKWQVERMGSSTARWSTQVVTTAQIDPTKDRIWLGEPVEGSEQNLPIHPYFLGAWLGDGHNEAVRITCGEQDMQEMRENLRSRGVAIGPVTKLKGRGGGVFGIRGLMPLFRELNLINNKHIPESYLRAEVSDRIELLRGLMDTDGSIVKGGHAQFTNSCAALVNSVCELLSSLGIRFHINWVHPGAKRFPNGKTYNCRPYAMVGFMAPEGMEIFSLKRKSERQITGAKRAPRRNRVARIISISEVPSVPVRCLSVDTPTHLFKVGRTMIPTHNTARGYNAWRDMWEEAKKDDLNQKTIFIGWWAHPNHFIARNDRRFERYGEKEPTTKERQTIDEVQRRYGHTITQEQLAWHRYKLDPARELEAGEKKSSQYKVQEQPSLEEDSFQMAGSSFFDHGALNQQVNRAVTYQRPSAYKYLFGTEFPHTVIAPSSNWREVELRVWDAPLEQVEYVISADVAYGRNPENDRSACQVLACYADCIEQVAEYASPTTNTQQYAWVIASLAAWYKNVTVIIELDGPGEAVWKEYERLPQIVRAPHMRQLVEGAGLLNVFNNVRNYIFRRPDAMSGGHNWHWKTGNRKEAIMETLKSVNHTGAVIIKSQECIEEMRTIARDGASIAAPKHKHDDRTMALAIGVRAWEDSIRPSLIGRGRTKQAHEDSMKMTTPARYAIYMDNTINQLFQRSVRNARLKQREERIARQYLRRR